MTASIRTLVRTLSAFALLPAALIALGDTPAAAAPAPVFGRSIEIIPERGVVLVTAPGGKRMRLHAARTLPVGTTLDVTQGTATAVSSSRRDAVFSADVSFGKVRLGQSRSGAGVTDLVLVPIVCGQASAAKVIHHGPRVRYPSGYHHPYGAREAAVPDGRFRLVGRYQTAKNVGPADWLLQDVCVRSTTRSATTTAGAAVARSATVTTATDDTGTVSTAARGGKATGRTLSHGQVRLVRCSPSGQPPISHGYCETLVATTYPNGDVLYGTSLFTLSRAQTFGLCITSPAGQSCRTWAFSSPEPSGMRDGLVTCAVSQRGDYSFTWEIDGIPLGVSLPVFHATRRSTLNSPCAGDLGAPLYPLGTWSTVLPPNTKVVNEYTLPTAGWLGWLSIHLTPNGPSGPQPVQGVVYQDQGGQPGALVGITAPSSFSSNDSTDYLQMFFEPELYLPAGNYWFGVIVGGTREVVRIQFEKTAQLDISANAFAAGPSDPFGSFEPFRARMSMHVGYFVDSPIG